jgi:hypothetical protein
MEKLKRKMGRMEGEDDWMAGLNQARIPRAQADALIPTKRAGRKHRARVNAQEQSSPLRMT